ncbi:sulfated surface glycoprotein 185-like [Lycium barbarum]|uniref:sulfated surface glycoprotein 185-like n=1 Tax=Lycium barbarum TaxID=112863 RepID=UPI00293F5B1F|nr:sulfated surface glycoprotein 185-like [Lycium barbarum]
MVGIPVKALVLLQLSMLVLSSFSGQGIETLPDATLEHLKWPKSNNFPSFGESKCSPSRPPPKRQQPSPPPPPLKPSPPPPPVDDMAPSPSPAPQPSVVGRTPPDMLLRCSARVAGNSMVIRGLHH